MNTYGLTLKGPTVYTKDEGSSWVDVRAYNDVNNALTDLKGLNKTLLITRNETLTSSRTTEYETLNVKIMKGNTLTIGSTQTVEVDFNIEVEDGGQILVDKDTTVNGNIESKGNSSGVVGFDGVNGNEILTVNGKIVMNDWTVFGNNLILSLPNPGFSVSTNTTATSAGDGINGVIPIYDSQNNLLGYIPLYNDYIS